MFIPHEDGLTDSSFQINPHTLFQITFEGVRGDGNLGDIAIDDVSFVGDNCIG